MTVPHLFRAERTATGQTDAFKPAGPGTQVTAQALVTGSGAVSATVKLQGTNTPSLSASWVDLATLEPSGTNAGVATATVATSLTAYRFDATAISGSSARATMSLARG